MRSSSIWCSFEWERYGILVPILDTVGGIQQLEICPGMSGGGESGAGPGGHAAGQGVRRVACAVEGVGDGGAAVAAAADRDDGDGRVEFAQACLQLAHGDVQGPGDHAFGDFEVLADVEDPGGVAALVGFGDGDFSHGGSPSKWCVAGSEGPVQWTG